MKATASGEPVVVGRANGVSGADGALDETALVAVRRRGVSISTPGAGAGSFAGGEGDLNRWTGVSPACVFSR